MNRLYNYETKLYIQRLLSFFPFFRQQINLDAMQLKMDCKLLLLIFLVSFNCKLGSASIMDWIWQTKTDDTTVSVNNGVPLISIPYESMTEDEKFLQQAAKLTDIKVSSPLEICQHKVIVKIRTSCSDMTEEELAKLSVNLLNCQSAVEGRKIFPCTEEMVYI